MQFVRPRRRVCEILFRFPEARSPMHPIFSVVLRVALVLFTIWLLVRLFAH
ncbi:hypothetical protein [Ancylobacter mangrovi]|uniref:hypothetical protein n=1 Tax=Ancylobacter mangrovi TaxID=2972472 RepID=UPI0021624B1D|nr:hypothetical protein [Ancylobacter mangrovi]